MEETMEKVPLLKEIVDHYSGPDGVTAKKQQEELERVSKTLPDTCPSSVKRFADRAVLSLQVVYLSIYLSLLLLIIHNTLNKDRLNIKSLVSY